MRSGTSYFDGTIFKKAVFRFWPMWALYFLIWLVLLPVYGLTALRLDAHALPGIDYGYMENFVFYQVPGLANGAVLPLAVVFGVLTAMAVFDHLFNARSANLFGSLPIRREGLFLTHYLAGLSFFLVPNLIVFLLTLAVQAAGGYMVMEGLLFWLAVACGEGFFFYTLAVFCAMFTGHILALPAFYAIVNFFVEGVTVLVLTVFQLFYYGFANLPDWVEAAVKLFTPVELLNDTVHIYRYWVHEDMTNSILSDDKMALEIEGLGTMGFYALAAVVLAVCAFLLYRRRRLESAGDVVAVNAMKPVFRYGVALCAGLALGIGTMAFIYGGELTLMIAIVVWGIVGYFAAEMLLQKSFKVFGKWKGALAVTAVFIVLFLVVSIDLTGFETRIPDPADVESVEVSGLDMMYFDDSGDYFAGTVTDPEVIRLVTVLHGVAVDQRDWTWETSSGAPTSLYVTYHLKNGGTLTRQYHYIWVQPSEVNQEGTAAWALQQIYNNRELCWQIYGFDKLEDYLSRGGRLAEADYLFYDGEAGWSHAWYYAGDAEALLAAVKEDFFAGRAGVRWVTADRWEAYSSGDYRYLTFNSDDREEYGYEHYSIRIVLQDTATGTLAALEKLVPSMVQNDTWYKPGDTVIVEPTTVFG